MINVMISVDRSHNDPRSGSAGLGWRAMMVKVERQGRLAQTGVEPAPALVSRMSRASKSELPGAMVSGVHDQL